MLVGDDGEGFVGAGEFDHGGGEAGAAGAVEPGGAEDECVGVVELDELFAGEFGAAVFGEWADGVGFFPRAGGVTGEDEVGGEVDEFAVV